MRTAIYQVLVQGKPGAEMFPVYAGTGKDVRIFLLKVSKLQEAGDINPNYQYFTKFLRSVSIG